MGKRCPIPEDWTAHQPHPDPRRELICKARAGGAGPSAAYKAHIAKDGVKATSIKSAAHHLTRDPHVHQRTEWLRKAYSARTRGDDTPITTETLRDLMHGCTDAMMDAMRSAELAGIASQSTLARLRKITVVHASRIGRSVGSDAETVAKPKAGMDVPPWCECKGGDRV